MNNNKTFLISLFIIFVALSSELYSQNSEISIAASFGLETKGGNMVIKEGQLVPEKNTEVTGEITLEVKMGRNITSYSYQINGTNLINGQVIYLCDNGESFYIEGSAPHPFVTERIIGGKEIMDKLIVDYKTTKSAELAWKLWTHDKLNKSLLETAELGDSLKVKELISYGVYVDVCNEDDMTPLLLASKNGHFEIVKCLIENGATLEKQDIISQTALHIASSSGYLEIVKELVKKGAKLNTRALIPIIDSTPLMAASYYGYFEVVEYLLENGADVNAKGKYGITALDLASGAGNTEIVKLLKEYTGE